MEFTLAELWGHMGWSARGIVIVMLIQSVLSLVVFAERLILYSKSTKESRRFAEHMSTILAKGDIGTAAKTDLGKNVGHLGRVIGAGLTAYRLAPGGSRDIQVESVARALERQGQREIQSFKRGLGLLATVGSTAVFIGLLGTVMGIITAFQLMAKAGSGGLGTVSAGISEALIATAIGLLVAIPAVMGFNYCQGWVDARAVDISESSNEFLDVVAKSVGATAHPIHTPNT